MKPPAPECFKSAAISPCGTYRYLLTRYWGPGFRLPFIMLNPSTADADVDDPTIRRCMGFARREGAGGIVVANLFALRATSPTAIKYVEDPIGPKNADAMESVRVTSLVTDFPIICAWGEHSGFRGAEVTRLLSTAGTRLVCLGLTKSGAPRHPLYVRADAPLIPFF